MFAPSTPHQLASSSIDAERAQSTSELGLLWGAPIAWVETNHSKLFIVVLLSAIFIQLFVQNVDLLQFPVSAAALIMFLGAPHGAFDVALLQKRYRSHTLIELLTYYIALTVGVLGVWWLMPGLALTGFLLIAAFHFGGDWSTSGKLQQLALGATLLTATTIQHSTQVLLIFTWLASDDIATSLVDVMRLVAPALLVIMPVVVWRHRANLLVRRIEACTVIVAAVVLPPITFFVLYFCLSHSVRHLIGVHVALSAESRRTLLVGAAPYAGVAIVGCGIGVGLLSHLNLGAASITAVFITLAALTVPHMLLVDDA
jgi:beta-carotene 15,15'-dioxygenase